MIKYVIGISAYYHDSSACLFKDDELVFACEEEKFTGKKHDNSFPINSINYIFEKYNLNKSDIDCVCYYENPILRLNRTKSFFTSILTIIKVWYNLRRISNKIHYSTHHMSHMMYSYLTSKFNSATIVSVDGVGETQTVLIGSGVNGKVTTIKSVEYPHSLGLFYSAMTAFLGFKPNEGEYKVMGLASYGDYNVYYDKVKTLIKFCNETIICDMNYFIWNKSDKIMFNYNLEEFLDMDYRLPNDVLEQKHKDLAASIQRVYEDVFFDVIKYAKKICNNDELCLGGGCAYNGSANGKIIENNIYKHIWIPPAPSDAGSSVGACLDYLVNKLDYNVRLSTNPFLGPSYTEKQILEELKNVNGLAYKKYSNNKLLDKISIHLNAGLVVGWYRGRIEFGARALGNRSILANPALPGMKDKINKVIKKREGFRPFAPMVCFDRQNEYFESTEYIPYMNQVVKVKSKYKDKLIAITHVDGTARVQSVSPYNEIYDLLKVFENKSGYPILLNTSFNIKDKTMVLTPKDAIETFLNTEMDVLVLENYIILKK